MQHSDHGFLTVFASWIYLLFWVMISDKGDFLNKVSIYKKFDSARIINP